VHAVLIGNEGLRAFAVRFHEELLPMAAAAGGRDVGVVDGRFGIACPHYLVNVAVAVFATGGNLSTFVDFRMDAVCIRLAGVGVTLRATDPLRARLMRKACYIRMTIHTREQAAVNGMLELVFVDVDADYRTVHILSERGIGVAGEAVGVLELLRGMCSGGPGKQEKDERTNKKPTCSVHSSRKRLGRMDRSASYHKRV